MADLRVVNAKVTSVALYRWEIHQILLWRIYFRNYFEVRQKGPCSNIQVCMWCIILKNTPVLLALGWWSVWHSWTQAQKRHPAQWQSANPAGECSTGEHPRPGAPETHRWPPRSHLYVTQTVLSLLSCVCCQSNLIMSWLTPSPLMSHSRPIWVFWRTSNPLRLSRWCWEYPVEQIKMRFFNNKLMTKSRHSESSKRLCNEMIKCMRTNRARQ